MIFRKLGMRFASFFSPTPAGVLQRNDFFGEPPAPLVGRARFWNGTAWAAGTLRVWNGTAWIV